MSGRISGVQANISSEYPKAIYIHCFCHSLNLAVQYSSKEIQLIRNTLDTIQELSNLIHFSPKRKALFDKIKNDFADLPSLTTFCPTRWTVKAKSFESVLLNYEPLLIAFQEITSGSDSSTSNFEVRSKANGFSKLRNI